MKKHYYLNNTLLTFCSLLMLAVASCKKNTPAVVIATPANLNLYAAGETDQDTTYRALYIGITTIGTQNTTQYAWDFDTGSGGLVVDANGIVPASMITTSGFNFTGDSTVVNGITITNQTETIVYGSSNIGVKVYGNLAYATVTIGDPGTNNITIKRLPFFLYYNAVDVSGATVYPHEFDIMGVESSNDLSFRNGAYITSPLSYYSPGTGLTSGYKLAAIPSSQFSNDYSLNVVSNAVTVGLTSADLSSSSGFAIHQLTRSSTYGYYSNVAGTITYGTKSFNTSAIFFDTGTNFGSFIDDPSAPATTSALPNNTPVTVTTTEGFKDTYTTPAPNTPTNCYLTYLENPASKSSEGVTVFGIEFIYRNQYMMDYTNHKVGIKNND